MSVSHAFLLLNGLLLSSAWLFHVRDEAAAAVSVLAVTCGLLLWQTILFSRMSSMRILLSIRKPHYIQTCMQLCIYLYWGLYWTEPKHYAVAIVVQVIFAYLFEMLLSLSRRRVWHGGFGPLPIVLSINLFLWFRENYFYLHFLLIAVTYLGKEFLTWNQDGKTKHIFNPSGFSLAVASLLLLCTGSTNEFTTGVDIVVSFDLPPNFYEVIFLLGLIVQFLFGTAPVTFGAVFSIYALFRAANWILGGPIATMSFDISIFLAMTFLVTDPSTSPKTVPGKFLFGAVYGCAVLCGGISLRYFHQPDYSVKILLIPALNLMVTVFDRAAGYMRLESMVTPRTANSICVFLHVCFFASILGSLKTPETRPLVSPRLRPAPEVSDELQLTLHARRYCILTFPEVYRPFGFHSEIRQYPLIKKTYESKLSLEQLYERWWRER